jgi:hypothetical protein
MAIYHSNIDIVDSARLTKAPFTWECTNVIGDVTLPVNLFTSIKVYMNEDNTPPARLHGIRNNKIIFVDNNGITIGYFDVSNNSSGSGFIIGDNNLIRGHVVATPDMPVIFRSISISNPSGVFTEYGDFTLLPRCHAKMFKGVCKSITLGKGDSQIIKHITTGELYIIGGRGTLVDNNDPNIQISIYNDVASSVVNNGKGNGIAVIHVVDYNKDATLSYDYGFDVRDRHLFITHKETSNVRVTLSGTQILLKGVTND